ncbi:spore coat protein [Paenibacillus sambharensis]|uniref:Spore coat protein n=1 Tax=Paenibacillus sambharensis TaxID=1803190 RepID=A0A2W1L6L6_9BACL|nr:spore coat protein [Paenibacillus sambharensis]PZD94906.1 spore coat protein [Paenibacillus sambharensis]
MLNTPSGLGAHEMLDMHELLMFKNTCVTKSKTMQMLVTDQELKNILNTDVTNSVTAIQELQSLLSNAVK